MLHWKSVASSVWPSSEWDPGRNGVRLKLEGRSDISRIGETLHKLQEQLPEGTTWHGVNIYLTLKDENGNEIDLCGEDGRPVGGLSFRDPHKVKHLLKKQG